MASDRYNEIFAVIVRPNSGNDLNEQFIVNDICKGKFSLVNYCDQSEVSHVKTLIMIKLFQVKTKTTRKSTPTTSSLVWKLPEKKLQRQLTQFKNKKLTTEQCHQVVASKMFITTLPEIMYILILVQLSLKQNSNLFNFSHFKI